VATNLRTAILAILSRDDLKYIVDDLELDGVDRRSAEGMRTAVGQFEQASVGDLLGYLYKEQLKQVCEELGLPSEGRKDDLLDRLLESHFDGMTEQPKQSTGRTMTTLPSPPEQGQLVSVRSRNWIVNEVAPSTLPVNGLRGLNGDCTAFLPKGGSNHGRVDKTRLLSFEFGNQGTP